MSIYKKIFWEAAKRVWKNPILWLLGLFTILFSGSVELDLLDSLSNESRNIYYYIFNFANGVYNPFAFLKNLFLSLKADPQTTAYFIILGLITLIAVLVVTFLAMIAQIGIINKIYALKRKNLMADINDKTKLMDLIKTNYKTAFSLVGLNIAFKIFIFLGLIVTVLPIAFTVNSRMLTADAIYVLLFIIITAIIIIAGMIMRLATINIIIKNFTLKKAISEALGMFKANWLTSVETAFMLFIATILGTLAILKIIVPALGIVFYYLMLFLTYLPFKQYMLIFYGLALFLAFVIFVWGSALISAFNIAVWTNLYAEIDKKPLESKISQIFSNLIKK